MKPMLIRGAIGAMGPTGPMHPDPQVGPEGPTGVSGVTGPTGPRGASLIDYMYSQSQVNTLTFTSVPVIPSLQSRMANYPMSMNFKGSHESPVVADGVFTYSNFSKLFPEHPPELTNTTSFFADATENSIHRVTISAVGDREVTVAPDSPTLTIAVDTGTLPVLDSKSAVGLHAFTGNTKTIQLRPQSFKFDGGLTQIPLPTDGAREGVSYLISDGLDLRDCLTIGGYTVAKADIARVAYCYRVNYTYYSNTIYGQVSTTKIRQLDVSNRKLLPDGSRAFSRFSPSPWSVQWPPAESSLAGPVVLESCDEYSVYDEYLTPDNTILSYPLQVMPRACAAVKDAASPTSDESTYPVYLRDYAHTLPTRADEFELSPTNPSFVLAKVRATHVEELVFLLGCTYNGNQVYAQAVAKINLHASQKMNTYPVVNSFIFADSTNAPTRTRYVIGDSYPVASSSGTYDRKVNFNTYRYTPCSQRVLMNYIDKLRKKVRSSEEYTAWWSTYGGHYRDYQST